jgi:Aminotransferase class I and II
MEVRFFDAIGVDLRHLERVSEVVSADVLDAWFDPSPCVIATLREHLPFLLRTSPPSHAEGFVAEIALRRGVPEECVLPGSGSSSLLFTCLPRLLPPGARTVVLAPMYGEYEHIVESLLGGTVHQHELRAGNGFTVDGDALLEDVRRADPDAILLVNPNNPTGRLWPREEIIRFLDQIPAGILTVIDEAYLDYAGAHESLESEAARRENLVVIKSMSKGVRAERRASRLPGHKRPQSGWLAAVASALAGWLGGAGSGHGGPARPRLVSGAIRGDPRATRPVAHTARRLEPSRFQRELLPDPAGGTPGGCGNGGERP